MTPDQILGALILAAVAVAALCYRAAMRGLLFWSDTEDE